MHPLHQRLAHVLHRADRRAALRPRAHRRAAAAGHAARLRGGDARHGRGDPDRSGQAGERRLCAVEPRRRPHRRDARRRCGDAAAGLCRGVQALHRRRLGIARRGAGAWRAGAAVRAGERRAGAADQRQYGIFAVHDVEPGRDRGAAGACQPHAAGDLSDQARLGRMDRHDEPYRAASRQRRWRASHPCRAACRRQLPDRGLQDLHHLGRARRCRQHRPPRACPAARRAAGDQGHLVVSVPENPARWEPQRPAVRGAGAQAWHPRVADLHDGVRRSRRVRRLSGGRGGRWDARHVHHDESRPHQRRPAGRGDRRSGLSGRAELCAGARPVSEARWRARAGAHHRA